MAKKDDPFSVLMTIAQEQQGYFTSKQAIEAGYADNNRTWGYSSIDGALLNLGQRSCEFIG